MNNFKIVVPTYNTEVWIQRCIESIYNQTYKNFECVIINDASTDKTKQKIEEILAFYADKRFKFINNDFNKKALNNIINGFNYLNSQQDPENILIVVDGDDFLYSNNSLQFVNDVYQKNKDLLLTYGNHIHYPTGSRSNCSKFPDHIIKNREFRNYPFISSHLRTYKSKLWYNINDNDLRDSDNQYYKVACDVSFMIPMLEMAGDRIEFIEEILYCYNRINPLSDDIIQPYEQGRIDLEIRKKKKYDYLNFGPH